MGQKGTFFGYWSVFRLSMRCQLNPSNGNFHPRLSGASCTPFPHIASVVGVRDLYPEPLHYSWACLFCSKVII